MNKIQNTKRAVKCFAAITAVAWGFCASTLVAQDAKVTARALTHQDITDYHLPEGTQPSGGLFTVGIGQPLYLEAMVPKGTSISNIVWSVLQKPQDSSAGITESPLTPEIPTFAPADREEYDLVGRRLFVPDVRGSYTLETVLSDSTDGTEIRLTNHVTAGVFVGIGSLGGTPQFPQCVICHSGPWIQPDTVTPWSKTGHATMFSEAIDGLKSSHYSSDCISCHVLGYDTAPAAVNGGFDDVAANIGWTFPAVLQSGNWASMSNELKNVSNIQCESCHGPGSEHGWAGGNPSLISVSYSAGDCAQCHSEEPYHVRPIEWENSRHAVAVREESASCTGCHGGIGFIDRVKGKATLRTEYEAITCTTCHDPHDATNPHQVRSVGEVALMNDPSTVIEEGGQGRLCMKCHVSRRDAKTYVETTSGNNRFGPHHGPQTDMLAGTNAVDYGKVIPSSGHLFAIKDSCVTCHLQETAQSDPAHLNAGGHTFKPAWDGGTPDDPSDDVHLVGACIGCHGPISSFNFARHDYNGDGVIEGVQAEVEKLLHDLALLLPPLGQPTVTITSAYTRPQLRAVYNYLFVEEDGSKGVHNPAYAVGLLKASIADLELAATGDADKDGLLDTWEVQYFGSLDAQNGQGDADDDGAKNALELAMGTNPTLKDTDNDGYSDYAEIRTGNDPNNVSDNPELKAHIYTAAEFEFASETGKTYQLQAVTEVDGGWVNVGEPITGTGDMISRFFSTRTENEQFYRVIELQPQ